MILSRAVPLLPLVVLVAAGCGGGDSEGATPVVVATTSVWADITTNVACGAEVATLVPAGADPHSYEASLRDRELVSGASVLVTNGAGLEASVDDLVAAAIADGTTVVEVATHVDMLDGDADHADADHADEEHADEEHADTDHVEEEHADSEDADDDHAHGVGDPHVWQDPTRVAGALDVIASALSAAGLRTCAADYHDELMALDAEIAETLAPVPAGDRLLVTSHDSLAYFADRYDFEIVGTVVPSTSTMGEASAGELAALRALVEERAVRAIFTDAFESASDAEALAARLGIPVVPLVTDALTDDAPTYADLMRSNAVTVATALAP